MAFLETEDGRQYARVFCAIRLQHILNDISSVETVESDKIIPESELNCTHTGLPAELRALKGLISHFSTQRVKSTPPTQAGCCLCSENSG